MKCWKCGQELAEGSGTCVYCGASQRRPAPVTDAGRALRTLYDRYGAREVLENGAYLVNGLADLTEDSKKMRNQLKMGMDAGLGRFYLEQLPEGKPDSAFDGRVKLLLTEEAGLNEKAAGEIAGYFDEMIGWRGTQSQTKTQKSENTDGGKKAAASNEVDRSGKYTKSEPEIDRSGKYTKPETNTTPPEKKKKGWSGLYAYEKATVIVFVASMILGSVINKDNDPEYTLDLVLYAGMLIPFFMSFGVSREQLRSVYHGGAFLITVAVAFLLLFVGIDYSHKASLVKQLASSTGDSAQARYLWQRHLELQDLLLLSTSALLFIQMIRHRILEKRK